MEMHGCERSREQRAESREQRAESIEQRAESKEQRADCTMSHTTCWSMGYLSWRKQRTARETIPNTVRTYTHKDERLRVDHSGLEIRRARVVLIVI
jgi:hypothetical protein